MSSFYLRVACLFFHIKELQNILLLLIYYLLLFGEMAIMSILVSYLRSGMVFLDANYSQF